jgi:hypothetical protein
MIMADVELIILLASITLIVGFGVGALLMLWNNPYWKLKMSRRYLKKNFVMLRFLMKNRRGFERIEIMNIDDDVIFIHNKAIIADKGRIWRTDASNILGRKDKDLIIKPGLDKNDGFDFYSQNVRDMLKMELDVPVLYIDEDNFKPIEPFLEGQERASPVSSSWLNTALNNAISIEVKKKMASSKMEIKDIIMMCGIVVCVYLVYSLGGTIDKIDAQGKANHDSIVVLDDKVSNIGTTIMSIPRNQTIIYNQGK